MVRTCIYTTLYEQLSLKLDFALQSQLLVHSCPLRGPSLLFHLLSKVLKGGPLPSKLSDWAIPINAHLRSLNTCPGTLRTAHFPKTVKCARSPAAGLTQVELLPSQSG
jgi:hypothetical protein